MLIQADTDYAIHSQVEAPQELRQVAAGEYRGQGPQGAYRANVPGLVKVGYTGSLGGSFDRSPVHSVGQQLRQQAAAGLSSVQMSSSSGVSGYMSIPLALITGFITAIAAFTVVLRRPYWG